MKYECSICGFVYDESKEGEKFSELLQTWVCPVCSAPKKLFKPLEEPDCATAPARAPAPDYASSPEQPDTQRTLSDDLVESFAKCGMRWVLGMVGHSNLGIANAVRKAVERGELGYVGIRHEGAAAFACSAYGKLTGKAAACLSIAGPGATNMLTGLCDASLDGAPAIALTGQVKSSDLGAHIFQELNLQEVYSCADAFAQTIFENVDCADAAKRAWRNAVQNGGVSQIIAPDDVQIAPSKRTLSVENTNYFPFEPQIAQESQLVEAAKFIAGKKRPVIILGWGARDAATEAKKLAEALNAPILTTYRAKGVVEDSYPLACGVTGLSGTPVANSMIDASDCIIGVGMGFSRHTSVPKNKPVVQIDSDFRKIGVRRNADFAVVGDAAKTMEILAKMLEGSNSAENPRQEISAAWQQWREEKIRRAQKSEKGELSPSGVCDVLSKCVPNNAIVSVDVGNVAYVVGRCFESANQRFLLSFYLGSIGVGLPSAIGAWCASQEEGSPVYGRPVVAIVGDGGFGQYLADWTTAVKYNMNIKCIVFNNSELAKITAEQKNAKIPVWQTSLLNPDFAQFSKLCGGRGFFVDEFSSLEPVLKEAFSFSGPAIINITTSPNRLA